jgi:FkbM family methyltransferase
LNCRSFQAQASWASIAAGGTGIVARRSFRKQVTLAARRKLNAVAVAAGFRSPCEHLWLGDREVQIWHRGSRADREAIAQNLHHQQYRFPFSRGGLKEAVDAFYTDAAHEGKAPLIVDAGAHIGTSAVWFATRYPKASVIAIEPDPGNAALLRRNARGFNIDVVQAGLGATKGVGRIVDPGFGEWSYRVSSDDAEGAVDIVTMPDVLRRKTDEQVVPFICKLDIEGAESGLFDDAAQTFGSFPVIVIELHDWMLPGQGSSRSFLEYHLASRRDLLHRGENLFSVDTARLIGAARPSS